MALEININLNKASKEKVRKQELQNITNPQAADRVEETELSKLAPKSDFSAAGMMGAIGLQVGKRIVNTGLSHVGTWGGDRAKQNQINNVLNTTNRVINAGTTIAAAGAVGGFPGLIIGAVGVAINEGLAAAINNANYRLKTNDEKLRESQAMERLGLLRSDRGRGV